MKKKKFYKLNVFGNDFIITKNNIKINKIIINNIKKICNRNYGIGIDGIIIYKKKKNKILIRIFNPDKTEANNCINGIKSLINIKKKNINKIETLTNNIIL